MAVLFVLMFIGGCFFVKANQAKEFEKNDYGVFLNADASSLERFKMYETIVIDAQYFTKKDIELLHQNGTVVYTYLNIGSIENFREYYTTYAELAIGEYEHWEEEEWVDVANPDWQKFIGQLSQELYEKGVDGFFIDNCDVYAQFRNRDYRLYHTVCPPYMVSLASASTTQWKFTDNPSEREYIDLMATISKETYHRLPTSNFKGFITKGQPHFKNVNWGQGWNASQMGFWVWKYYNTHTDASTANGVCTTDAPLFRLGEILLNYAEAMYELGQFDQSIADETINKLRKRAHVADMVLTDITTDFDPDRDQDVNPLLWEIRRERRVELMGEGTRLDDLRRWKKGHYVDKQPTGVYLKNASEFNVKVMNGPSNNEGYVYYFEKPLGWLEHYYLNPIPLNQLALNPALEQNPGWENNK